MLIPIALLSVIANLFFHHDRVPGKASRHDKDCYTSNKDHLYWDICDGETNVFAQKKKDLEYDTSMTPNSVFEIQLTSCFSSHETVQGTLSL